MTKWRYHLVIVDLRLFILPATGVGMRRACLTFSFSFLISHFELKRVCRGLIREKMHAYDILILPGSCLQYTENNILYSKAGDDCLPASLPLCLSGQMNPTRFMRQLLYIWCKVIRLQQCSLGVVKTHTCTLETPKKKTLFCTYCVHSVHFFFLFGI